MAQVLDTRADGSTILGVVAQPRCELECEEQGSTLAGSQLPMGEYFRLNQPISQASWRRGTQNRATEDP